MAIPPFPSQDLAKLVLGYLAEEQLMTAYDEFLQASPYLDALRNEYDRILMTSLKHILAEYRAVKIYVETCKPFALRKKLLQCYNLLEMVKFLIQNVDINKLNEQEQSFEKSSFTKNVNIVPPSNPVQPSPQSSSQIENSTLDSSVEATSLEDLPGNSTIKKKTSKALDTETKNSHPNVDCQNKVCPMSPANVNTTPLLDEVKNATVNPQTGPNVDLMKCNKSESVQKIEEFNNILDYVCKNGNAEQNTYTVTNNVTNQNQRLSTAGTFQDFATGIYNSGSVHVSYSNTTSDNNAQAPLIRNTSNTYVNIGGLTKEELMSKGHLVLTVDSSKNSQGLPLITTSSPTITQANKKMDTRKREENKIKILSDVIVDKSYESLSGKHKMPPVLSNATSTPFQMPNILINGTPAYKNNVKSQCLAKFKYTTDEIMAMPTIILVPASVSGTPATSTDSGTVAPLSMDPKPLTVTSSSSQDLLKPLLIDVTSPVIEPPVSSNIATSEQNNIQSIEQNLIKTVESTEHVLKSKDNTINTTTNSTLPKTTTPQGLLPNRKSSSTPRRNSHVRVLDFTTPRRILTETINEQSPERNCSENTECNEAVPPPCKEPKIQIDNTVPEKVTSIENTECPKLKTNVAKENKVITKKNWDADIRAAAVCGINTPVKPIPKQKNKPKEKATKKKNSDKVKNSKKIANKDTSKEKKKKDKSDSRDYTENDVKKSEKAPPVVKANVNIRSDKNIVEDKKIIEEKNIVEDKKIVGTKNIIDDKKIDDKKTTDDKNPITFYGSTEQTDTPENERIALQNVIGAKLNISDLLETPYKQVLYDIQMDTPKFLGTDLPDEPMSEVKIMSIPTPRFLRDSNEKNSTPSCCYSSRPTDYSSGGSYYKPDDQDFIICTDVPESPLRQEENIKSNNDITSTKQPEVDNEKNNKENKSGRPVRQCTKNVSYNPLLLGKGMPLKSYAQSCVPNDDSPDDNASDNRVSSKSSKDTTVKEKRKQDTNKSKKSVKKIKSPIKRDTPKTFMKIKPRRTTPTKEILGGKSRKTSESSNKQKKTNSKERNENLTPVTASIPTKSRRKSSTPRKLHCTKTFNSESSDHTSPETDKPKQDKSQEDRARSHESDVEQMPLRWSDDGSQEKALKNKQLKHDSLSVTETDDISKIKEYIETCATEKSEIKDGEGSLHIDLIKRGFDVETAKKLERDLLDSPCAKRETDVPTEFIEIKTHVSESITGSGDSYSLKIEDGDDDEDEEIELSIHECNEDTVNYIHYEYEDGDEKVSRPQSKLKDNYSMEICVDDGVTIRLRATTFSVLLDQDPQEMEVKYNYKETAMAVSSISNFDKLYTPLKDHKAQMYDIFDSTLTSLDTPLKIRNSISPDCERNNVTEISLEVEKVEYVEKTDLKKRKRLQSGSSEESINCNKKTKRDTQYLLNTTNIQNIDIESVLSKLHGP
ncbi:hypothetical protein RR48_11119 [Papilio machaon]|uniref:LisH domain-containing protein n=1 Tax=Papilio machaon TaxID=76193 RepID=A0A194RPR0_PAPMA|nr:hypothetical protein RR48_11119 [Papilio machaon]